MTDLGYNYRMTDFQCALGISQLSKLPNFLKRRQEIAALYDEALANIPGIKPLGLPDDVSSAKQTVRKIESLNNELEFDFTTRKSTIKNQKSQHAYHLYVVKIDYETVATDRETLVTFCAKRELL
jgi:dTDP-4-amino-4,6-dideoxygalactose transaminase